MLRPKFLIDKIFFCIVLGVLVDKFAKHIFEFYNTGQFIAALLIGFFIYILAKLLG